jgi:hypothetical protein
LRASRERRSAGDQSNGETQKVSALHDVLPFSNCFLEVMLEEVLQLEDECSLNRAFSLPHSKSSPRTRGPIRREERSEKDRHAAVISR